MPKHITYLSSGLYVADFKNSRVLKLDLSLSTSSLFFGTGSGGDTDGVVATSAKTKEPYQIIQWRDRYYVAEGINSKIKRFAGTTKMVTTLADDFSGYWVYTI
eukprot:PhF_6_TR11730/c0_g1_i3/m.19148